ncbi:MAG: protease HtpX, partial [Acidobacteria bacterium]|nr:protease HtpX [Acidobacteriota bacterium]
MKRIALFLMTNIGVLVIISLLVNVFNVHPLLHRNGLDLNRFLIFSAIVGFTGSFVSLFLSKFMAKMAYGIKAIQQPCDPHEMWIYETVRRLAKEAGIGMPEVGIYRSPEPNAFATGWNRNNALVAVSTGLLERMNREEVEAVLGHEISHVSNGDMVTLALIQGVVNTFVVFISRIVAQVAATAMSRGDDRGRENFSYGIYFVVSIVMELVLGIFASMIVFWFSRRREFRADAGSARLVGAPKMIAALQRLRSLQGAPVDNRAPAMATMKISHRG